MSSLSGDDADFFTQLVSVNLERNDLDAAIASLETAASRSVTGEQRTRLAAAGRRLIERFERRDDSPRLSRVRATLRTLESSRAAEPAAEPARAVLPRRASGEKEAEPSPVSLQKEEDSLELVRRLLVSPEVLAKLRELVPKKKDGEHEHERERGREGPLAVPVADVVAKLLSLDLDVGKTAEVALDLVVKATGADRGFLLLSAGLSSYGLEGKAARPPEASEGILQKVLETGETVLVEDAATDERFGERSSVRELGVRSVLAVPVLDPASGRGAGVIYLDAPSAASRFGPRERDLAVTLAQAIAPGLRNARRFEAQGLELDRARRAFAESSAGTAEKAGEVHLLGKSRRMKDLRRLLDRVAPGSHTVLIEGESGTGKELVARWLHERSERSKGPFIAENLGALAEGVLEAELFGHAKGAFTGADRARPGLFQLADGGTLFLDEIGEVGLDLQRKLLRVLQEREVRPVGGTGTSRVDIRVLAATHRNLGEMVKDGTFREDLFYRLSVIRVRVPPLRERREDVPLLFQHFLEKAGKGQARATPGVPADLLARLASHDWPGNVRELEAFAMRFSLEGPGAEIGGPRAAQDGPFVLDVRLGEGEPLPLREVRQRLDRAYVALVLERFQGNVTQAAKALEMNRSYVSDLVKRLGLRES